MAITAKERQYLIDEMIKLLSKYGYNYSLDALNNIIDEWAEQKSELITAFMNHPKYVEGKFMIAFSQDYQRPLDISEVLNFERYIINNAFETCENYQPEEIKKQYEAGVFPFTTHKVYALFADLSSNFRETYVNERMKEIVNNALPEVRIHIGEKTSRVINKICQYLGYSKHPSYNQKFARCADALNPITIKRHTIISINPLDYLTMSFGNSWSSCHTIDKNNERGMPNNFSGCYSSGTISYMLDESSIVFYTVDASYDGNDFWAEPKITRQMFHFSNNKLVQGRLYPQDNPDDNTYSQYRNIIQEQLALVFNFNNLWRLQKGYEVMRDNIQTRGTHYCDYLQYQNCTLSTISELSNDNKVNIGASPICIRCGKRHDVEGNIDHCSTIITCACCGRIIEDEDDARWIDGSAYCDDCSYICEDCGSAVLKDDAYYVNGSEKYICDYCYSKYYTICEDCQEVVPKSSIHYMENGDCICDNCYDNYYVCDGCNQIYHLDYIHYIPETRENLCDDCYKEYSLENAA